MTVEEAAELLLRKTRRESIRYPHRKVANSPDLRRQIANKVLAECKREHPDVAVNVWSQAIDELT